MTVEEFLDELQKSILMLENKIYDRELLRSAAESSTAAGDGERVQSSSSGKKMENAIIKMCSIDEEMHQLRKKINSMLALLETLPACEYDLLHKVYVQGYTLKQFERMKKRGHTWTSNTHKKAKAHLQERLRKANV